MKMVKNYNKKRNVKPFVLVKDYETYRKIKKFMAKHNMNSRKKVNVSFLRRELKISSYYKTWCYCMNIIGEMKQPAKTTKNKKSPPEQKVVVLEQK